MTGQAELYRGSYVRYFVFFGCFIENKGTNVLYICQSAHKTYPLAPKSDIRGI